MEIYTEFPIDMMWRREYELDYMIDATEQAYTVSIIDGVPVDYIEIDTD